MNRSTRIVLLTLAAGALFAGASSARAAPPTGYEGFSGISVEPRSEAELRAVLELADRVVGDRVGRGRFLILVGPDGRAALAATSIPHQVVVPDVATAIELERARISARQVPADFGTFFEEFRTLDEINTYMEDLATLRPDLASVEEVGDSFEGHTFRALRINGSGSDKPVVMTTGTQHAQEWMAAMVSMCIADALVRDYDDDPEIHDLLDSVEFIIAPVVNPDGYLFTWDENGDRYWRKNRNGAGVDLNRNWSFDWGDEQGSSGDPDSHAYRGETPFSEAETSAIRDFAQAQPRIDAAIDLHAFGQYVLFPYGCREADAPDHDELESAGLAIGDAIMAVHDEDYTVMKGASWYPACGVAPDWFYDELGALSFTIELRPAQQGGGGGDGMAPPPELIIPTCEEIMAGVLRLGDELTGGGDGTDTGTDSSGDGSTGSSGTGGTETGPTDAGSSTGGDGTGATDSDAEPTATETDGESSTSDEGTEEGDGSGGDGGCGCTTRGAGGLAAAPFVLVLAAVGRRRRPTGGGRGRREAQARDRDQRGP